MASRILARVSERTRGSLLMTLETVFGDTLARSATSWIVTDAGLKLMAKETSWKFAPILATREGSALLKPLKSLRGDSRAARPRPCGRGSPPRWPDQIARWARWPTALRLGGGRR